MITSIIICNNLYFQFGFVLLSLIYIIAKIIIMHYLIKEGLKSTKHLSLPDINIDIYDIDIFYLYFMADLQ